MYRWRTRRDISIEIFKSTCVICQISLAYRHLPIIYSTPQKVVLIPRKLETLETSRNYVKRLNPGNYRTAGKKLTLHRQPNNILILQKWNIVKFLSNFPTNFSNNTVYQIIQKD